MVCNRAVLVSVVGVIVLGGVNGAGTSGRSRAPAKGHATQTILDAHPGFVPQLATPGFEVTVSQMLKKNGAQAIR
jgi:hypothetical protein